MNLRVNSCGVLHLRHYGCQCHGCPYTPTNSSWGVRHPTFLSTLWLVIEVRRLSSTPLSPLTRCLFSLPNAPKPFGGRDPLGVWECSRRSPRPYRIDDRVPERGKRREGRGMKEGRYGKRGKEREKDGGIEVRTNGVREGARWRGRRMDTPIFKTCMAAPLYCIKCISFLLWRILMVSTYAIRMLGMLK